MRLDHVIVAVANLQQAMADYRSLGFTVRFGGEHAGGVTHNALICLADGSYIELIAPVDSSTPPDASPYLGSGRGFAGFALLSEDLQTVSERLDRAGLAFDGPNLGGRQTPGGEELRWQSLFVSGCIAPFLIADVTPRRLRVPNDAAQLQHANGAVGIHALHIATPDLARTATQYRAILDLRHTPPVNEGAPQAYRLSGCTLHLSQARTQDFTAPRPTRCVLHTQNAAARGSLDLARSHGASFECDPVAASADL